MMEEDFWGEVISTYTNEDALNDGLFVLLSSMPDGKQVAEDLRLGHGPYVLSQGVAAMMDSPMNVRLFMEAYKHALWDEEMKIFEFKGEKIWVFDEIDCIKIIKPEDY